MTCALGTILPVVSERLRWLLLAAVPSSLMWGVLTYITTDISPMPGLLKNALLLYAASVVFVLLSRIRVPHRLALFLQPIILLAWCFSIYTGCIGSGNAIGLAFALFFVTALVCHGELARIAWERLGSGRPAMAFEIVFWLLLGIGLGLFFNSLIAPMIFYSVIEFPLALVLGCLLRPRQKRDGWSDLVVRRFWPGLVRWFGKVGDSMSRPLGFQTPNDGYLVNFWLDLLLPYMTGAGTYFLILRRGVDPRFVLIPLAVCFLFRARPIRLGLGFTSLLVLSFWSQEARNGTEIYENRSYFGVLGVGDTGSDKVAKSGPSAAKYYHSHGPAGNVMKKFDWLSEEKKTYPGEARSSKIERCGCGN